MTLYKQLTLGIFTLFVTGLIGTLILSTSNMRTFLEAQLDVHAQDTATSLGLSVSTHLQQADMTVISSMIDAVFDRGYFQSIKLIDINGDTLIERTADAHDARIPSWFINLVSFRITPQEAMVISGWKQAGSILVTSNPWIAYHELWSNARETFWLFLAGTVVFQAVALLGLYLLLRPLKEVEKQAESICQHSWLLQDKLPKTRELRRVVLAMNKLTARVRDIFSEQATAAQELRKQTYLDPVTNLGNRRFFDRQSTELSASRDQVKNGALLLLELSNLSEINETVGYQEGDLLLQSVAALLRDRIIMNGSFAARLSGGLFGIFVSGIDMLAAETLAAMLCTEIRTLQLRIAAESDNFAHIGIAHWTSKGDFSKALKESDLALQIAAKTGAVSWHAYKQGLSRESVIHEHDYWQSRVQEAIQSGNICLLGQPVYSAPDADKLFHREILSRLTDDTDASTAAQLFHPFIDHLDCAIKLDRQVIEVLLEHITSDNHPTPYAVNISAAALADSVFREWLCRRLETSVEYAHRVHVEFAENALVQRGGEIRDLVNRLESAGCLVGVDHFGKDFHPFAYLSTIKFSYIKVDGYYTHGIDTDLDNQFVVKTLRDTAHSLGIKIIAQSVETKDEYDALRKIKLDAYQGYALAAPLPL